MNIDLSSLPIQQSYDQFLNWVVTTGPIIFLIIVLLILALNTYNYLINKAGKVIINQTSKDDIPDTEAEKRVNTLINILKGAGKISIWIMFLLIFLKKIGLDIGPLLAGAGILGLAVGFGAQELVRDVISGFFLLLENQVRTGDVAIINGTGGLVEKIELRTITLRDFSGVVHVIQNGKINSLSNMTKEWSAMVFDIGVAYKEDVNKVIELMKQVGEDLMKDEEFGPKILEPIEVVGLDQFADSAIVIKARLKTKPIAQWSVGREYRKRLKYVFDEQNIEIPFPHTTVYWGEDMKPVK